MKANSYIYSFLETTSKEILKWLKHYVTISIIFLVQINSPFAQENPKIDSLKLVIKKNNANEKADALILLAEQFYTISSDSVYKYANKALTVAKVLDNGKALAKAYNSIGVSFYQRKSNDSAKYYYEKALNINQKNDNKKGIAANLANIGTVLYAQNDYTSALEYYLKASEYEEVMGESSFGTLTNIGLLLSNLDRNKEALNYLKRDLKRAKNSGDLNKQIPAHVNLASVWLQLKDYDSAYHHAGFALRGSKKLNMSYGIGKSLTVMANTCIGLERYDEGLKLINTSITQFKELNIPSEISNAMAVKATLLEKDKKYIDVLQLIEDAKPYIQDNPERIHLFMESKYKALKGLGRYNQALQEYEYYVGVKDSLFGLETQKQIVSLEQKYEHEKNRRNIDRLTQDAELAAIKTKQRNTMFLAIGIFLLLVIAAILFMLWRKQVSNRIKMLQTEQRLNRARMDPHFFFNAMASLQNVAIQEKSTKTTLYTSKLAKIMRQSLESTYEEVVTVEHEIDFLTQYLEIQKLRYPDKFDYEFHLDDSLELNELKLPGMLMQPFIENAIEHGFKDIDYKGKLDVTFKEKNNELIVVVEDNGRGLNTVKNEKTHKSRAMQIIKDRLFLFNKQHKSNATYKIENANKSGFKIIVTLPILY